jgi:cell division septation protein DedD
MGNTSYGHELSAVIKFNVEAPNSEVSPTQTPTPEPTPTPTTPLATTTQTAHPMPSISNTPTTEKVNNPNTNTYWIAIGAAILVVAVLGGALIKKETKKKENIQNVAKISKKLQ